MNNPEEFILRLVCYRLLPYEEIWPNIASRGELVALRERFPNANEFIAHCNNMQQEQYKNRVRILKRFIDKEYTGTPADYARIAGIQSELWYRSTEIPRFYTDLINLIKHVKGSIVMDNLNVKVTKARHIIRLLDIHYSRELPFRGRKDLPYVLDQHQALDYWRCLKKYGLSVPDTDNDSDSDEYVNEMSEEEVDDNDSEYEESEAEFTDDE